MYCRKLQNGKWTCTADASPDPKTGKRRQVTRRRNTKREAQQAVLQGIREMSDKKPSEITIQELYEEWIKIYSQTVKDSTAETKKVAMLPFIEEFKAAKIVKITHDDIQNFLFAERDRGLSQNHLNNLRVSYSMMFNYAIKRGYINQNPLRSVVTPKEKMEITKKRQEKKKFLEPEEIKKILKVANSRKYRHIYPMVVIILSTGVRISELLALKWSDIDLENRTLEINKTLVLRYINGETIYNVTPPKTKKANRVIRFNKQTASILKNMKLGYNKRSLLNYLPSDPEWSDLVFVDMYKQQPYNIHVLLQQITQVYKKAGLPNASGFHILRHTHTTMLVEAGVEIPLIMQRLGHSDSKITMEIYSHVTQKMQNHMDDKMTDFFQNLI